MSDSNLPPKDKRHQQQQERNSFLQQIADLTPELLFVIDLDDLEVIYINKKAEDFLGLEASYVYEQGHEIFKAILHPEDYQRRMQSSEACKQLPPHKESEVEVRLKSADGNWSWFRIREKVFKRDMDGAVLQTIGIAQNIHEQKMADERLKEEHRRFKDAQAIGYIGSFERALPGELIKCSEEFLRIHGLALQPNELSFHQLMSLVHPDDQEAFQQAVRHTHATGEPLNVMNRIVRPDGSIRHVHRRSEIIKNDQGTPIRVYGTIQDVTEQVAAREKEQTTEALMREAEAVGNFGSFKVYLSNGHFDVSEGLYRLFGYDSRDIELNPEFIKRVTHPDDLEKINHVLEQAMRDKEPFHYHRRIFLPNGALRQLSINGKVVCDEAGNPCKLIGIVYDITELQRSEQTIQQMLNGSMAAISILESVRDEQGTIIDFIYKGGNKAAEKVLNGSLQDMQGKSLFALHSGVKGFLFDQYVQVVETGEPLRLERYKPYEGIDYWFDISAVKNGDGFILTFHDVTDQKKAEQEVIQVKEALAQQATDRYLKLFNSIDEGFCVIEVIFQEQKPIDFRYIDINPAFEKQTGLKNALGRRVRELVPDIETYLIDLYGQVALSGESICFENHLHSLGRWFDVKAFRIGKPQDRQVAVLFSDITERKRQQANLAFLAELQYDFTRLSAAEEIIESVGEKMFRHFGLSRLRISDVDEAADTITTIYEKPEPHLKKGAVEKQPLSNFVSESYKREFKSRRTIPINNISTDPRTAHRAETYQAWSIGSQLHAPFVHQGLWCFLITLQKSLPYQWRPDERELLQEIATRLYLRLKRARTEAALRESEAKYRDLFNSIDQGFVVTEVIFDENNTPADYRILEVNHRFQNLTGISREEAQSGKTIRQIIPNLEEKWYQYGRVVLTGEPLHLEEHSQALGNRWFELYIFRSDGLDKKRMAILFNDITNRKRAEERIKQQNAVLEGINRIFHEALTSQTEEELGRVCLNVAEEVTGSRISFMGEINPKTGKLDDIAISDRSWKEFGVQESPFPRKLLPAGLMIHGIYGRVLLDSKGFFTNDPPSHPDSIGTPKSHPKLDSFLGVPLIEAGSATGMIGLANREGGYGPEELEMAEALAPAIVQAFLRKRMEKALRKSEKKFRAVADLVPDLLWSNDPKGVADWYNQQWQEFTGLTIEESLDSGWLQAIHPEDRDGTLQAFQDALASGEVFRMEHRFRRYDGAYRWFLVQAQPLKDDAGKILRWYGSATDVHEERIALEKVRHSEEQFRFMANSIPQMIWIKNTAGKFEFFNKVFFDYTGILNPPTSDQEVADLIIHPEDIAITRKNWEKSLEQKSSFIVEHRIKSASGEYRWFLVRAEPFVDGENGKVVRWFGTSTDIQDRKCSEEALIRAKEEAEKAAKAKEEFLSTMSHEIRTPLNAVVGFTHLLLQQNPREDQKEGLNGLRYSSRNLMSLINDILDFSKIEAGKVELEESEFDLLDLMFSIRQAHQPGALENNTQLKLSLDDDIPEFIITDQLKLSQVLHNLVGNAVKFTRQGVVSVEVNLKAQEKENVWLEFAVVDTGIGIAKKKIDHIFEKFSQADSSTIRHYGGTGLGLSITKMLLELMDSQIKVESQEGKGSRFYFTLPVKAGTGNLASGEYSEGPEEEKYFQQVRILLVEDVELNRLIIKKFLKEWWSLVPDEAVNGKEAVEKARHKTYDLILMDVRMPEMNGYEATRQIRDLPGKKNTPVIALTADTGQDLKQKSEAALFTDVITKPFEPGDLRRTIMKYITGKPEKPSNEASSDKGGHQPAFGEVEKQMHEDPEDVKDFYKLTYKNLQEYKKAFKEALMERDQKKFGDMKHKATILLDTFRLDDLKAFLTETKSLLEKNDAAMLKQAQNEGERLFDQKMKEIQTHFEQRFS